MSPGHAAGGQHRCLLCQADDGITPPTASEPTVVHLDDAVVALIDPEAPGVLVAPRSHADSLTTVPTDAGAVLGALRRAALVVQTSFDSAGTSIEPTTDLPGATGHVCYRIVPTRTARPLPAGSGRSVDARALAAALRQVVATHDTPAPG